jgi:hypothetical protein
MVEKRHATGAADIINRVAGATKKGKRMKIGQYTNGYYYISFVDGGKLPNNLKGKYTNYDIAQHAVDKYLGEKNG